ncbi:LOW QUALITY PROTEIN: calcium-activated chloride channel regulator 1 [Leptinotarsa decemlineata]|uniref:LOW QUALITY PROTEIN: calcium-activated chloride channel regulator 1 n=1 Tax=Leptinotarsa decemlineata TaxID=7539 RepID=UPI003D308C36
MDTKLIIIFGIVLVVCSGLELKNGAYEDLVIKVADNVPQEDCTKILQNLESTLTSASQYLFSALDSRAFLRSATVILPSSWADSCVASSVLSASGEMSDITIIPSDSVRGPIWTQQSLGCGQPGDQIYVGYQHLIQSNNDLARFLIKNFAMYRYGVFEEQGHYDDPIYPMCYYDDQSNQAKANGCSDLPINGSGVCSLTSHSIFNRTSMVDEKARSSIMFAAEAPSISMFCDEGNHNRLAPTKHNFFCERRSVLDVIMSHKDFLSSSQFVSKGNHITDTTPRIVYKKQNVTRYVFVIENSKNMMQRESWSYLRLAMRQWARYVLPDNSEIGMVLFDSVQSTRALNIVSAKIDYDRFGNSNRDKFYSAIPYTPSESLQSGCLHCSLNEAANMLKERTKSNPANNVIVAIAAGMALDDHLKDLIKDLKEFKIKVATINYPSIVLENTLGLLAKETGGADYAVFEEKLNVDTTSLTTYFELHNILYDIVVKFSSVSPDGLPIEIHRREITDDGRLSVTGSFMLDSNMGEPAQFTLFTHNTVTPLIKGLKLISPSHQIFTDRNDKFIDFKMITLNTNISEVGTWTYTVEPYQGNPQPHFIQVMATPQGVFAPVIRANFRTHRNSPGSPLILLVEVKYGDLPILGSKVEVTVTKVGMNGSKSEKYKIELLDSGSGDPDITRGDGIYTRYFSTYEGGPGLYTFEVVVDDNGNTAYTWSNNSIKNGNDECCGSSIMSSNVQPVSPFQRVLPKISLKITSDDLFLSKSSSVGRIGNLKTEIIPDDLKVRLSWTSPDMAGEMVSKYEIRYADSVLDILDKFETNSELWDDGQPLPLAPGSETTFTLDFNKKSDLLDRPLYFAIKAYSKVTTNLSSPISNWVRIFMPAPSLPSTTSTTYPSIEQAVWPNNALGKDSISTSMVKSMPVGLELILPVVIGLILLLILSILYCYFCIIKRRGRNGDKKTAKETTLRKDNLSSTITIVPSSPPNVSQNLSSSYVGVDSDSHQICLPANNYGYEEDSKKRYSLVNQQEHQLIEELKQQQQLYQQRDDYGGVSVISVNTVNRNQPILSPFNSWSASQLLHEHERRRSPLDLMDQDQQEMSNGDLISNHDHLSSNGHQVQEHYPPPVPPLPIFNDNRYPVNYDVYGLQQTGFPQDHSIYQSMNRREQFNSNIQGSMSSVNSGEKKIRNVTMV